ncbi:MAG: AAA15 family ATPase/GTPase, partial [Phenylobacterium sp.]
ESLMISRFAFSNFYSFADETEVSFEVSKKPSLSYFDVELNDGVRLNKIISIIGANGSGKTQLLRPLAFLSWFISKSFLQSDPKDEIPIRPHMLKADEVSTFELEFYIGSDKYKYKLETTVTEVIHESLYQKTSHLYSYVFIRDLVAGQYIYKQKGFLFNRSQAEKIRGNVSLIAAAHIHDSVVATKFIEFFDHNVFNLNVSGRDNFHEGELLESADFFYQNDRFQDVVSELLGELDLGLSSVEIEEVKGKNEKGEIHKFYLPIGVHDDDEGSFRLPFFDESNGTQSAYVLLRSILPVLETGGVVIWDEMDNDLHLHMLLRLIELFKFEHTNPHHAQLIFTCHTHEVLNAFKKHQHYLVEKNSHYSESWRLDEVVGLRADDNIYAKYQAGALGAVPNM